jgi:hypothetical protein
VTWENAAIWVPIRDFVSRYLSMSLGFFHRLAPHTRPKEVGLKPQSPDAGRLSITASVDCGRDVTLSLQPSGMQ